MQYDKGSNGKSGQCARKQQQCKQGDGNFKKELKGNARNKKYSNK